MIEKRKKDHIEICLEKDVESKKSSGFEDIHLIHHALTNLRYNEIDTSAKFLEKTINMPLAIDAMTGGFEGAKKINEELAKTAEKFNIAMFVGSQRPYLQERDKRGYELRQFAPTIPLIGNIGISQIKEYEIEEIEAMLEELEYDAIAVHLNTLQEMMQPEGEKNFSNNKQALEEFCESISFPVIVKETGAGISHEVAKEIFDMGVEYISTGGLGGTNWAKIELYRNEDQTNKVNEEIIEWGITTVESIYTCSTLGKTIASGGLRSGIDVAKSIALGADLGAMALPFLKAQNEKRLDDFVLKIEKELKTAMLLTNSKNIKELGEKQTMKTGKIAEKIFFWNNLLIEEEAAESLTELNKNIKSTDFSDIFRG